MVALHGRLFAATPAPRRAPAHPAAQVSLLQVVRQLVPRAEAAGLYIPGGPIEELRAARLPAKPVGGGGEHLYVSRHNVGAMELAHELGIVMSACSTHGSSARRSGARSGGERSRANSQLRVTDDPGRLDSAGAFLLLLDAQTWGGGVFATAFATARRNTRVETAQSAAWHCRKRQPIALVVPPSTRRRNQLRRNQSVTGMSAVEARRDALVAEVAAAMRKGIKVVLAHECDWRGKADACVPFGHFLTEGQTPPHLLAWGLCMPYCGSNPRHADQPNLLLTRSCLIPGQTETLRWPCTAASTARRRCSQLRTCSPPPPRTHRARILSRWRLGWWAPGAGRMSSGSS